MKKKKPFSKSQLRCVCLTPALDRRLPLLPNARSISLPFLYTFSPPKVHLLYSVRKRSVRNPGNLPVRVLDIKKPEHAVSLFLYLSPSPSIYLTFFYGVSLFYID